MSATPGVQHHLARLGGNAVIYGIGSVLPRLVAFVLLPLYTAYLQPEEYGVLAMLGVLTMILQPVFALGITAAMGPSFFESAGGENRSATVWTAFFILVISSALLLGCAWLIPQTLGRLVLLAPEHADLVSLSLTGCALTILTTPFMQWLQFEERARLFVAVTVTTALFVSVASVVCVVRFHWGARGLVLAQLWGAVLSLAAFLLIALQGTRLRFNRTIGSELLGLGVRMVPSVGLLFVLMHGNKHLLKWLGGLDQLGVYSVGFSIGTTMSVVVGAISTSWYPFFMSFLQRRSEAEVIFGRIFTYYVFGAGYLSLLFFIFAKPVVVGLTQPSYWAAHAVIGPVSLAYFFIGVFNLFLPGLYFAREVGMVTVIQAITAVISVPLNYLLIARLGLVGAAIGIAVAHLVMAALTHGWNRHRTTYPNIRYEWKRVATFGAGALAVALVTLTAITGGLRDEIVKAVLLWLVATALLALCLNAQERQAIRSRLQAFGHAG